jgi:hypothetical protein
MKRLFWGTVLLALVLAAPRPTQAGVDVNVTIGLPPPIFFAEPPALIVLPESYVYVVPDVGVDIFFYDGWWWRPWQGHWYRSAYYDSGWAYYRSVPAFYVWVPSGWRNDYRDHRWRGHPWSYERIPHQQVQRNWKSWKKDRYWEKQHTWGVKGLEPRTRSQKSSHEGQQPRQSRSSGREDRLEHPQHHREAGHESREAEKKTKHREGQPHQQGGHERGEGEGQGRR